MSDKVQKIVIETRPKEDDPEILTTEIAVEGYDSTREIVGHLMELVVHLSSEGKQDGAVNGWVEHDDPITRMLLDGNGIKKD